MIDEILEALSNGKWHDFQDIFDTQFQLANIVAGPKNSEQVIKALDFLEKFEFIEHQTRVPLWRLAPSVQQFLQEIKQLETEQRT